VVRRGGGLSVLSNDLVAAGLRGVSDVLCCTPAVSCVVKGLVQGGVAGDCGDVEVVEERARGGGGGGYIWCACSWV
jgi:hypothetical protein